MSARARTRAFLSLTQPPVHSFLSPHFLPLEISMLSTFSVLDVAFHGQFGYGICVHHAIDTLYRFWQKFENLAAVEVGARPAPLSLRVCATF